MRIVPRISLVFIFSFALYAICNCGAGEDGSDAGHDGSDAKQDGSPDARDAQGADADSGEVFQSPDVPDPIRQIDYRERELFHSLKCFSFINEWIRQRTHGKISGLLHPGDLVGIDLTLINTVYFKAKWQSAFSEYGTYKDTFSTPGGSAKKVDMMRESAKFLYHEGDGFKAVNLPYEGSKFSFVAVLPEGGAGTEGLLTQLQSGQLVPADIPFAWEDVYLRLPKFEISYKHALTDSLKALGMVRSFDKSRADFTGIAPLPFNIAEVIHKSVVKVDESGTEAAGVTVITMDGGSADGGVPVEWKEFYADRPFIFIIQENFTGAVLFIGLVNDPTVKDTEL